MNEQKRSQDFEEPASPVGTVGIAGRPEDRLVKCVVHYLTIVDRPPSLATLLAGLPTQDGNLTPALAIRALERAGFAARIVKRSLEHLKAPVLPAIVLLNGGEVGVLIRKDSNHCDIWDPVVEETVSIPIKDLASVHTGYSILARQESVVEQHTAEDGILDERHWFWSTISKLAPTYVYVAIAAVFINLIALASPLFVMNVYDRVLPNKAISTLWVLAIGMGAALFFDLILKALRSWLIESTGRRADVLLASRIYSHVLAINMSSRPGTTGSFASQLREFENVREFFTSNTIATATDMLFLAVFLFVIYQIGGPMAYVPMAAAVIVVCVGLVYQLPLRKAARENTAETTQRHSLLVETIASLETIKSIRAESGLQRLWEHYVGASARTIERVRSLTSQLNHLTYSVQQMVSVGIVVVGAYLFKEGEVTTGAIIACVMLASRAVAPLGQFAMVLARLQQSMTSLKSLNAVMQMPSERPAGKAFLSSPLRDCLIEFQNVVFAYRDGAPPALDGFSLTVRPGERVGIIGKIGSGKTTIGRLLVKLYEPQQGAILVDGIDMRQLHPHDVRSKIGLLGQDAELLNGTVRSNILMGNQRASDGELVAAAEMAGVDEFVRRHPSGYDMLVGERGQALSGGQKQAVALARLLIGKPHVTFLDEPSSAMDMASERVLIQKLRNALKATQTVIISTHRYSMLDLVDRLVVIANGKVAADGPKAQILEALKKQSNLVKGKQ